MLITRVRICTRHKVSRLTFAGLVLGASIGMAPASAQGLFESLFGIRASEPAPLYQPRQVEPHDGGTLQQRRMRPQQRQRGMTQKHDAQRAARSPVAEKRAPRVSERGQRRPSTEATGAVPYVPPQAMPGPAGRFLQDATLKSGDVIVTSEGLMVFRGSPKTRHSERDFVPLSRAGALIPRHSRTELAQLDSAIASPPELAQPSSSPILAQDDGG